MAEKQHRVRFYYDSINSEDLKNAYAQIFTEMKQAKSEIYQACTVTDPMPIAPEGNIEFIGFYDKDANLRKEALQGTHADAAENTARYDIQDKKITWDLKNSGYRRVEEEGGAIDLYRLQYRVRLTNETAGFVEDQIYLTNDTTILEYQKMTRIDEVIIEDETKEIEFPIPKIKGFVTALAFQKVDTNGAGFAGCGIYPQP